MLIEGKMKYRQSKRIASAFPRKLSQICKYLFEGEKSTIRSFHRNGSCAVFQWYLGTKNTLEYIMFRLWLLKDSEFPIYSYSYLNQCFDWWKYNEMSWLDVMWFITRVKCNYEFVISINQFEYDVSIFWYWGRVLLIWKLEWCDWFTTNIVIFRQVAWFLVENRVSCFTNLGIFVHFCSNFLPPFRIFFLPFFPFFFFFFFLFETLEWKKKHRFL